MINVGIIGASGFVGSNILKLLLNHSKIANIELFSNTYCGKKISDLYPEIKSDLVLKSVCYSLINKLDVVFLAVPHGKAKEHVDKIETKIIDMTSDHRTEWVYGLPEIFGNEITKASKVANPGCYATSCILNVYPIIDNVEFVVFDSISGYSGGGKNHGYDIDENIITYKIFNHRHIDEMRKVLSDKFSFTPHVVNAFRGIMTTSHIKLKTSMDKNEIIEIYKKFYDNTFTKVLDKIPDTKSVANTPFCFIGGFEFDYTGTLIIISVLDNLLKGAASQAVENMNLIFGLPHYFSLDDRGENEIMG